MTADPEEEPDKPPADTPQQLRHDQVLARVARLLAASHGLQEGANQALEELSHLYASSSIGIWTLRHPGKLTLIAHGAPADVPDDLREAFVNHYREVPAGDLSLPGPRVMEKGSPIWFHTDEAYFPSDLREFLATQEKIGILLGLPVKAQDEIIGCAIATFPDEEPLPEEELSPLDAAVSLVALLSQNERLKIRKERQRQYRQAAIGEVAAEVAHEVNNPLQGILSLAEMLLSEPTAAAFKEDLSLIISEAQRAAAILGNLLNFASPEEPEPQLVDVRAIVDEIAALKQRPLALAKIRFTLDVDPRCPPAKVTPSHLRQVLHNIIGNARHAIEEDLDGGEIRLHIYPKNGGLELTIQDTGPGLPPSVRPRLFDPFFTTKSEGKGTGLGLAVSRGLIEANGGRIYAENWGEPRVEGGSKGEGGALFRIWLPADGADLDSYEGAADPSELSAVLVVDDEPVLASVLERYLTRRGLHVDKAHSAADALAKLGAGRAYDIVLVDVRMPGMNGPDLFTTLQELYPGLTERVAFMSGDIVSPDIREFLQAVARPVLGKPFTLEQLDGVIRTLNPSGSAAAPLDRGEPA